jgi:hypothetical protein
LRKSIFEFNNGYTELKVSMEDIENKLALKDCFDCNGIPDKRRACNACYQTG